MSKFGWRFFSAGHRPQPDGPDFVRSRQAGRNVSNLRAGRVRGHGRSGAGLRVQPDSRSHAARAVPGVAIRGRQHRHGRDQFSRDPSDCPGLRKSSMATCSSSIWATTRWSDPTDPARCLIASRETFGSFAAASGSGPQGSGSCFRAPRGGSGADRRGRRSGKRLEMFVGNHVPADDPRLEKMYSHFRKNLGDICEVARKSGARVIVCTVGTNLEGLRAVRVGAPFGPEPGGDGRSGKRRTSAGVALEAKGRLRAGGGKVSGGGQRSTTNSPTCTFVWAGVTGS